jgi:hypothetical protein
VVLVSSAPDGTADDPAQSLVAAKGLGVPVFIAGVGPAIDRSYLQQLTDAAGGRFTETNVANGIVGLLADVSELLRNQYVVTFDASGIDVDTTHLVDLHVEVAADGSTGAVTRIVCPGVVCAVFKDLQAGDALSGPQRIVADVVSSEQIQSVTDGRDAPGSALRVQRRVGGVRGRRPYSGAECHDVLRESAAR